MKKKYKVKVNKKQSLIFSADNSQEAESFAKNMGFEPIGVNEWWGWPWQDRFKMNYE